MTIKINQYCVVDSAYTLLIYLLAIDSNTKNTLFIISDGIPKNIANKLENKIYLNSYKNTKLSFIKKFFITLYFLFSKKFFQILKNKEAIIYGQDHLFYSFIFTRFGMHIIEDGIGNYYLHKKNCKYKIRKLLSGGDIWAAHNKTKSLYLTAMRETPVWLNCPIIKIDLLSLWQQSLYKSQILFLYGQQIDELNKLNFDVILLTQPFSEDGVLSEKEKISLYKKILAYYSDYNNVAIKPHPREQTNYNDFFSISVLDSTLPSQLLFIFHAPKIVVTCFSSSLYSINNKSNVHMYGTSLSKKLEKYYGTQKAVFN